MKLFIKAVSVSFVLLLLCGIIYPLGMTGISKIIFPKQANGSIIKYNGKRVGSELLGQSFSSSKFLHGRISSINYNTYRYQDTIPDKKTGK